MIGNFKSIHRQIHSPQPAVLLLKNGKSCFADLIGCRDFYGCRVAAQTAKRLILPFLEQ